MLHKKKVWLEIPWGATAAKGERKRYTHWVQNFPSRFLQLRNTSSGGCNPWTQKSFHAFWHSLMLFHSTTQAKLSGLSRDIYNSDLGWLSGLEVEEEFASKQTKSSKVTIFGSLRNNSFSYIWNLIIQGLKVVVRRSYSTYSIMPCLMRDAKYPHPHRALSGAISGPDSAALRRTMWFCRRVWPFDCGSCWNRKENSFFSVP